MGSPDLGGIFLTSREMFKGMFDFIAEQPSTRSSRFFFLNSLAHRLLSRCGCHTWGFGSPTKTVAPLIHPWPSADSARLPNEQMAPPSTSTIINAAGILGQLSSCYHRLKTQCSSAYCNWVEGGTEQDRFNAYCLLHLEDLRHAF